MQSDSSPAFFPLNTISSFRNQMATPLELDSGEYEVALAECSYTYRKPYLKKGIKICDYEDIGHVHGVEFYEDYANFTQLFDMKKYEQFKPVYSLNTIPADIHEYSSTNGVSHATSEYYAKTSDSRKTVAVRAAAFHVVSSEDWSGHGHILDSITKLLPGASYSTVGLSLTLTWSTEHVDQVFFGEEVTKCLGIRGSARKIDKLTKTETMRATMIPSQQFVPKGSLIFGIKVYTHVYDLGEIGTSHQFMKLHTISTPTNIFLDARKKNKSVFEMKKEYEQQNRKPSTQIAMYSNIQTDIHLDKDIYSIEQLITFLNRKITKKEFLIEDGFVIMKGKTGFYESLNFTEQIKAVLGITETQTVSINEEDAIKGLFLYLFDYGQTRMFIYSNIVTSQHVGNEMAPIVRITNYTGKDGKLITQQFTNLQYVPVRSTHIEYIHMYIKSESGENLPFDVGTYSSTLHFRRKRF